MKNKQAMFSNYLYVIFGSTLFAFAVNYFIIPLNLYNGGLIGIAQVIRTLVIEDLHWNIGFDFSGILNFMFNLPLFFMAYKVISRKFFYLTLCSIITQTIALTLIPIPSVPLINDILTSLILGGLIGGFGIGVCLQKGGSGAGIDILGVYFSIKYKSISVGKLSMMINACIYVVCAMKFNIQVAIYSLLYAVVFSMVVDRIHFQNIAMSAMIFTKNKEVKKTILEKMTRGVTYWHGMGAFTDTDTDVLVTIISKYEVARLKKIVLDIDPQAFIILNEGLQITGNYERRLIQ